MSRLPQLLQRSFLDQFGRLTRSATSLRARIRDRVGQSLDTAPEAESTAVANIMRVTAAPERLIVEIEQDATNLPNGTRATIVFLGDYIDRGLQSRDVIELLLSDRLGKFETVFLMGNHEEALLKFLDDESFGSQWVRYGGGETLYSYGFQPPNTRGSLGSHEAMADARAAWSKLWAAFRERLPPDHLAFYQALKPYHSAGDYFFVHAGLRPDKPMHEQSTRDMLWIRDEFLDDSRHFSHLIVHGHTPAEGVYRDNRRIGLDTGAFLSGKLSAVKLIGEDVTFLTT